MQGKEMSKITTGGETVQVWVVAEDGGWSFSLGWSASHGRGPGLSQPGAQAGQLREAVLR